LPYPIERALLLSYLGFISYLRGGDPLKGAWACRQAYLLARDLGNVFLQALTLMHEYFSYALLGNISIYENIANQLDKLFKKFFFPEISPYYFINLGQNYLFQGEFLKAAELFKQAQEAIEQHGELSLPTHLDVRAVVEGLSARSPGHRGERPFYCKYLLNYGERFCSRPGPSNFGREPISKG
jgi:tetratricopeptide (TPR) repeat protein